MDPVTISLILAAMLKLIDVAAGAIQWRATDKERYETYRGMVEKMVTENRQPTPEEWAVLFGDMNDLTRRIEAARAARDAAV